jgi:hypothetical protein
MERLEGDMDWRGSCSRGRYSRWRDGRDYSMFYPNITFGLTVALLNNKRHCNTVTGFFFTKSEIFCGFSLKRGAAKLRS